MTADAEAETLPEVCPPDGGSEGGASPPASDAKSALSLPGDRHVAFHLAEFDVYASVAESPPDAGEGHDAVMQAAEQQQILVKTVTNEDWIKLIRQLQGRRFRTSLSLPPPLGKGMRFFGKVPGSCLGLIWDRRQLDLSSAFVWPSGYFAKSHYNVDTDGKLLNGREEALVTLEDLEQANASHSFFHTGRNCIVSDEPLPYNEVMAFVEGTRGLVGIFARSTSVMHLLWAMGVRALLARAMPAAGHLPLFVHETERGLVPFGCAAQRQVVRLFLRSCHRPAGSCGLPCLPVDADELGLDAGEQLALHGAYGLTSEALGSLVSSLLEEGIGEHDDDTNGDDHDHGASVALLARSAGCPARVCAEKARAILAAGLHAAVEADNAASAMSLVQRVGSALFRGGECGAEEEAEELETPDSNATPSATPLSIATYDSLALSPVLRDTTSEFARCLHELANDARSPSMLATIGATIALDDFASGRMLPRIMQAEKKLEAWLSESKSVVFRMKSWRELKDHHYPPGQGPAMTSFLSHKAIANRTHFYEELHELQRLEEQHDLLHGMAKLHRLVGELHHPCLRLEMLQYILGLDARYDLETVTGVANIAYRVISHAVNLGVATPEGKPSVLPTNTGYAPLFQLEATACRMQGVDYEGVAAAPVATF